jgi:hypothetical protein
MRRGEGRGLRAGAVALAVAAVAAAARADDPAAAAPAGPAEPEVGAITAARRSGAVHLDGRLDEEAWRAAPVYARFVESFPATGRPANLRTEVRVLYDDETLYVGVTCADPSPALVSAPLARRDSTPVADRVEVALDTGSGGRNAYLFSVNAAGVLRDALLYSNVSSTDSWDAVWDGAAHVGDRGWAAELAIPLNQLRFPDAPEQRWRILVRRHVPRTHQILDSALVPPHANPVNTNGLVVARLAPLEAVRGIARGHVLELLPYVATRATLRPQYSDPTRPDPRLLEPALDLGLDLRTPLGKRLTLTGALNPDFGQVETDQVIQNVQNFEQFFPEKRPFFLEGLDVFQPVGTGYGTWQQLFYSRRIGLDAPILASAKVTGMARPGLDVGVLDAVVTGAANESLAPIAYSNLGPAALAPYEANPDGRWRFRGRQPFHFGPESALPAVRPVSTNFLAAVARQQLGGATAGAMVTAATPLEARCHPTDFASDADYRAAQCASYGANAAALDLSVPGDWGGFAQVEASQATGGPPEGRKLPDGTVLRGGDLGYGGHFRWGKLGGEPWRFDVVYAHLGKTLDLNATGFQPLNDFQWTDLDLAWVRPSGLGPFHAVQVSYNLDLNWSADGRYPRGVNMNVLGKVQLPGYETVALRVAFENQQYDTREIPFAGIAFQRDGDWFVALELGSDPSRALSATGDVFFMQSLGHAQFERENGWGLDLNTTWRPHARVETRLDGSFGQKPQGPRYVDTLPDGTGIFGRQNPMFVSATLRQQVVFTPRLTAQLYVQLFSQAIRWGSDFYGVPLEGRERIDLSDLAPVSYGADPASHDAVVNVNAVLRWEYRVGSTFYLVYTRSQSELPVTAAAPPSSLGSPRLLDGPVTDSVMVKWTWWRG